VKSYRQLVREAGRVLKDHELGGKPKVLALWNSVEWQEMPQPNGPRDAELSVDASSPVIRLYPGLLQTDKAVESILREFGLLILASGGKRSSEVWDKKYDLPTPEQIKTAAGKLTDHELRKTCKTYSQLKDSYPERGSAVDRLVFIHIANALLANNIPLADSVGVDITKWGPTVEYAAQKRYHSLTPLVSAYCPPEVVRCFGCAFAELIVNNLRCCRESTVAAGLRRIVANVVSRLEAYPALG
jgi:hypothetical protein